MDNDFAVIFDWDGVIVDSSAAHKRSWEMIAAEIKKPLPPDHFERSFGRKNPAVIREILQWSDDNAEIDTLSKRKEWLYREIIREEGLSALPGVVRFLKMLKERGVPLAVGSSTPKLNLDAALEQLQLRDYFCFLVTGDDVSTGKPDPEVFLKAAQGLSVFPSRCIVFEDAPVGIEAALRAGMKAVALLTSHSRESLKAATKIVKDLSDCDYVFCKNMFA